MPPIITGSIDTNAPTPHAPKKAAGDGAISFGTAVVKPAPKPVGIQIASDSSVDGLRLSWSQLTERHADKLNGLGARFTQSGDPSAPNFNLVAGPIKSKAEAKKICKDLAAQQVNCKVSEFKGQDL